jgi:hypothetical protein
MRSFRDANIYFNFLYFKIQIFKNFQMTSNIDMIYIKVIDPIVIFNFVVENLFIWDRLEAKIFILFSDY